MPELPEVESAVRRLRKATVGKTIANASVIHPALKRRLSNARIRALRGATVSSVDRRGKHQLMRLDDGRTLHAHFRMAGDWTIDQASEPLPRFARAWVSFDDGSRVVLDDPRALSTLELHAKNAEPDLGLGPEPSDEALTADYLMGIFAKRRGPIKPVLLDQRVIAGLGNIYAAEALWQAKISPLDAAKDLSKKQVTTLISAIRKVIKAATGARYTDSDVSYLAVYDREGQRCRRRDGTILRIVQAGRSTYYCPGCQH
ncbi:MAG TPA: bifunctional DNA-formamidopyrimidine glycosylase/DNA-(apurinic or apyrimidinic site) lyase [Gemmatimonadaceae bacterium]|jgi:formamidopyrimidine-DNA glycosylase